MGEGKNIEFSQKTNKSGSNIRKKQSTPKPMEQNAKKPASGLIFLFSNASEASSFRISHRALNKNHYLCEKFKNHL